MLHNKKGVALAQVLLITVVLAGMTAMLLRVSLSRANTAKRMNQKIVYQLLLQSCQAEVSALWAAKTPEAYARDFAGCNMYRDKTNNTPTKQYTCNSRTFEGDNYEMFAKMTEDEPGDDGLCAIEYNMWVNNNPGIHVTEMSTEQQAQAHYQEK